MPILSRRRSVRLAALAGLLAVGALAGLKAYWEYHSTRAARELRADHPAEAERHARACLRVRPSHAPTLRLLARVQRVTGDFDGAEDTLRRIKEAERETTEDLQLDYVLLRAVRGEFHVVEPGLLRCVAENHPRTEEILELLATAYVRQLNLGPALVTLRRWVAAAPDSPKAYELLGWVQEQTAQPGPAAESYRTAVELDPGRVEARERWAAILVVLLRWDEAAAEYDRLAREWPDRPAGRIGRAQAMARDPANAPAAMEDLRAVVRDHPDLVDAYLALAALENDFGSPAEAERLLLKARDLDPFHVVVRHQLVAALRKQPGRPADVRAALAELEETQRLVARFATIVRQDLLERPNDPAVLTEYGGLLLRAKKEEMGRYWLQQALAVDPAYRPAHQALYDHFTAVGDTQRAAEHKPFLAGRR